VARAFDVDARHQRDVGYGVDHSREVDDHVDPLEQRLQLGAGDVDPLELHRARASFRLAHVEAEDALDVGMRGQHGQQMTTDETGCSGDRNGMHPHTLTAWPTRLNLETPRSPTNPAFPAFRPFSSAVPAAAISIPRTSISRRSTSRR
jgi:hypothetical protein